MKNTHDIKLQEHIDKWYDANYGVVWPHSMFPVTRILDLLNNKKSSNFTGRVSPFAYWMNTRYGNTRGYVMSYNKQQPALETQHSIGGKGECILSGTAVDLGINSICSTHATIPDTTPIVPSHVLYKWMFKAVGNGVITQEQLNEGFLHTRNINPLAFTDEYIKLLILVAKMVGIYRGDKHSHKSPCFNPELSLAGMIEAIEETHIINGVRTQIQQAAKDINIGSGVTVANPTAGMTHVFKGDGDMITNSTLYDFKAHKTCKLKGGDLKQLLFYAHAFHTTHNIVYKNHAQCFDSVCIYNTRHSVSHRFELNKLSHELSSINGCAGGFYEHQKSFQHLVDTTIERERELEQKILNMRKPANKTTHI